jgi:ubiquinone/menaquinone biosynthesis C-methylase UbiE
MSESQQFNQSFYEEHIWGSVEISFRRKGIDTLKLERLVEALPDWQNVRCLEVGCGAGRYLRALERILPRSVHLAGCDISTASIDLAKRALGNIEYRLQQPDRIPWQDGAFDVVCFLDVLEHIENPKTFLIESLRVLKVGGILHASVPLEGDPCSLWHWFDFIGLHDKTKRVDGQIQRFTGKGLKQLFLSLPLEIEQEFYSYHVVGNVLDLTLFTMLNVRRILGFKGSHYDVVQSLRGSNDSFMSAMLTLVESLMYIEGRVFGNCPGPNAHFTLRKLS